MLSSSERFERIYANTYYKLYGFAKRYLKDQEAIKDVLQECYIRLWEKMETVDGDEKILPMLRSWIINATIDCLRKNSKDRARAYTWLENQEKICMTEDALHTLEGLQRYRKIIAGLPPQQRLVFSLAKEEGLSHKEIAERLQISVHTIKRHLSEAMRTISTKVPENTLTGILLVTALQSKLPW